MRLVLEPERPLHGKANPTQSVPRNASQDEPPIIIPLSSYAETSREPIFSGGRLAAALILILLIAFGFWFARNRNSASVQNFEASIRSGYDSTVASLKNIRTHSTDSSNQNPALASVPPTPETSAPLPLPVTAPESATPAPPAQDTSPNPAGATSEPQRQAPAPVAAPVVRRAVNKEALVAAEASAADEALREDTAPRVVVPAAKMEDALISSRVPIFPEAAKANGVEGRVVMQAIINKDGSVGHLHVISGDLALRRAATDAVSTWRYRPYLVNGEPVNVSTTISVDFFDSN